MDLRRSGNQVITCLTKSGLSLDEDETTREMVDTLGKQNNVLQLFALLRFVPAQFLMFELHIPYNLLAPIWSVSA
ncbi:MAG: hypothetical protein GX469_09110 [Treponema sp.]|nr:hypothetical protein [Treponema sp.]